MSKECNEIRDLFLLAILPHVVFEGWSKAATAAVRREAVANESLCGARLTRAFAGPTQLAAMLVLTVARMRPTSASGRHSARRRSGRRRPPSRRRRRRRPSRPRCRTRTPRARPSRATRWRSSVSKNGWWRVETDLRRYRVKVN